MLIAAYPLNLSSEILRCLSVCLSMHDAVDNPPFELSFSSLPQDIAPKQHKSHHIRPARSFLEKYYHISNIQVKKKKKREDSFNNGAQTQSTGGNKCRGGREKKKAKNKRGGKKEDTLFFGRKRGRRGEGGLFLFFCCRFHCLRKVARLG